MDARVFKERYGPWALILGASEGIGASCARRLAAMGLNLVLVARKPAPLDALAEELRAASKVEVKTASVDLFDFAAIDKVEAVAGALDVGLLIYNAGAEAGRGLFLERPLEDATNMVGVNVVNPVRFLHRYGRPMAARGHGGAVLFSSMAANQGTAGVAVYAGVKAFDRVLAEGLWMEFAQSGLDLVCYIPGLTDTPAQRRKAEESAAKGLAITEDMSKAAQSDDVAAEALEELFARRAPLCGIGSGDSEARAHKARQVATAGIGFGKRYLVRDFVDPAARG